MFFNEVPFIQYNSEVRDPLHELFDYKKGGNMTIIPLIFIPIFLLFP